MSNWDISSSRSIKGSCAFNHSFGLCVFQPSDGNVMNSFATENMAGDTEGGGSTVWFITTTPLLPTGPGGDDDPLIGTTFNDTSASSLWTNATDEIYSDAYDDNVTTSSSSVYSMAWPMRSAWIAIFAFMLVVAFVGNTLVAWVVLGNNVSPFVSCRISNANEGG